MVKLCPLPGSQNLLLRKKTETEFILTNNIFNHQYRPAEYTITSMSTRKKAPSNKKPDLFKDYRRYALCFLAGCIFTSLNFNPITVSSLGSEMVSVDQHQFSSEAARVLDFSLCGEEATVNNSKIMRTMRVLAGGYNGTTTAPIGPLTGSPNGLSTESPTTVATPVKTTNSGIERSTIVDLFDWETTSIADLKEPRAKFQSYYIQYLNATGKRRKQEIEAIMNTASLQYTGGKCKQPFKTARRGDCCLGSISRGGDPDFRPQDCPIGSSSYNAVRTHAIQELAKTNHLINNNVENCDVCQIVDVMMKDNLTMAFMGDSMTMQTFIGMKCELQRRGYDVRQSSQNVERPKDLNARHGITSITTIVVSLPQSENASIDNAAVIRLYKAYLPNPADDMAEFYNTAKSHDIFVFNFGLHVREKGDDYKGSFRNIWMVPVFSRLRTLNFTLLAYRETAAQHFSGAGGSYWTTATLPLKSVTRALSCTPLKDEDPEKGWREPHVRTAAEEVGYKIVMANEDISRHLPQGEQAGQRLSDNVEVAILPFYNFTAPHYDLHPHECTHYCSTPFLWMPLWRGLRLALDRKYGLLL